LYLSNPDGMSREVRRGLLDGLAHLNEMKTEDFGDPEIATRIAQYEMAYKMQASVPELTDFSNESEAHRSTCTAPRCAGRAATPTTASWPAASPNAACVSSSSCTPAGTSTAISTPSSKSSATDVDAPSARAGPKDLKQRGLLDDTLVIWGGEFGRTPFFQGKIEDTKQWGRDHHPYAFTQSGWPAAA
jgi:hypothetical protein